MADDVAAARPAQQHSETAEFDCYWQAYADLMWLRARGLWSEPQFRAHYDRSGKREGRKLGRAEDIPKDWSDWLYFRDWTDDFELLWRRGILPTGAYAALAGQSRAASHGRASLNRRLGDLTSLSPEARAQIVEHAQVFPGSGPLRDLARGRLRWTAEEVNHILPLQDLVAARFPDGADQAMVMPWLQIGGAERVGVWHHRAAEAQGLRSVIILCDGDAVAPFFAGHSAQVINLPEIYTGAFGVEFRSLSIDARCDALLAVLEALHPRRAHLVHSYIGYTTFTDPGTAERAHAAVGSLHVSAFCTHVHSSGVADGYFRYVPALAARTARFVFDNRWYRDDLKTRFGLPESQLAVLDYPIEPAAPIDPRGAAGSNKVLWASRLDAQKNPRVLGDIARALPELEFLVYGGAVLNDEALDWASMPPNVTACGAFAAPADLPFEEVFAFLYTSRFDGMPLILMDVGSRGMPIVTPKIGGIGDLMGADWPHYVAHPDDVDGYVAALRLLHESMEARLAASARMLGILAQTRSVERFMASAGALLPNAGPHAP
ncbi:MAG: glycosyltransferase [Pseudomonadota bacterium]